MEFELDRTPPSAESIAKERENLFREIKQIKTVDMIISFALIILSSAVISFVVYTGTGSLKYAAMSATIFPIIAIVLSLFGITSIHGFRSVEMKLIELNNAIIALSPVFKTNRDVARLCDKYSNVNAYMDKVKSMGRELVNGELAMFWAWDASTAAKMIQTEDFFDISGQNRVR